MVKRQGKSPSYEIPNGTFQNNILRIIILLTFYSVIINTLFTHTPRVFVAAQEMSMQVDRGWAFYIRSFLSLLTMGFSSVLFLSLFRKKYFYKETSLLVSVLVFSIPLFLSMVFSYKPTFSPQALLLPLSFLAILLLDHIYLEWFIHQLRKLCLTLIYGSLIYALILPRYAIEFGYSQGYLFSFRLHGIATLANHLAPFILVFWIINRIYPHNTRVNYIHYIISLLVLIATQSKTTWLAALLILAIYSLIKMPPFVRLGITFITSALVLVFITIFSINIPETVATLTGRTVVWMYTIELWQLNPLFGYGLDLWRDESRTSFLLLNRWAPGQAHNQVFQTLGQSGVVGLFGLLIYIITLVFFSIKYSKQSNYVLPTLLLLILVRAVTESSLAGNLFTESYILHFSTFVLISLYMKRDYFVSQ